MTSAVPTRYTSLAIVMHWVLALALIMSFSVGLYMADLPLTPQRVKLFNWHKWAGITILALSLLRLLWRLSHRPPADLPTTPWQQRAARWTHGALYLLFFAVPLTGWAYSSAAGFPIVWFGVLPLPDFVTPDKALAEGLKTLHSALAWALAALAVVHVGAALKHHFIDRDKLLSRMFPNRS